MKKVLTDGLPTGKERVISRKSSGTWLRSGGVVPPKTTLNGAIARNDAVKARSFTGSGRPAGSPRKSTGCTNATSAPCGKADRPAQSSPACSQSRRRVPLPSGLGPKAVTSTPRRDNSTPACDSGSVPRGKKGSELFLSYRRPREIRRSRPADRPEKPRPPARPQAASPSTQPPSPRRGQVCYSPGDPNDRSLWLIACLLCFRGPQRTLICYYAPAKLGSFPLAGPENACNCASRYGRLTRDSRSRTSSEQSATRK